VTRDADAPKLNRVNVEPNSCGLNKIKFSLNATDNGTGIDKIEYGVKTGGEEVLGVQNVSADRDLEVTTSSIRLIEGKEYIITARVFDKAGNPSNKMDGKTKATNASLLTCDTTAPEVHIYQKKTLGVTNATLVCNDKQSGCKNNYQYTIRATSLGGTCTVNETQSQVTIGNTVQVREDSFFCYIVKDNNNNVAKGQQRIQVDKVQTNRTPADETPAPTPANQCSNGVKDSDETDIDCGGYTCAVLAKKTCTPDKKCLLSSDCASGICTVGICEGASCTNGRQDGSETDVDCGGSCGACQDGLRCQYNTDCGKDSRCLSRICSVPVGDEEYPIDDTGTPEGGNLLKMILLILGSLTTLGGAGYSVLYKQPAGSGMGGYSQTLESPVARFKPRGSEHGDELTSATRQEGAIKHREKEAKKRSERDKQFRAFESGEQVTQIEKPTHHDIERAFKDLDEGEAKDAIKELVKDEKVTGKDIEVALKDLESSGHLDVDAIDDLKKEFKLNKK
jgi:hypothetical protein